MSWVSTETSSNYRREPLSNDILNYNYIRTIRYNSGGGVMHYIFELATINTDECVLSYT